MAKYSARGLIVNFLAYLLCLSIGYLSVIAPTTAVVLTVGLIITTVIRGFFLFRFEALYSSGPARWRSYFFLATLLGAVWWSVILVSFTLTLGMIGETPLLWLYTIIFFSTTIHVTSPFKLFSRIYLAIALLPATLAAIYIGGFDGYMYGVMMLVFVAMLHHQIELLSETHWERLEANYALKQKARALEVEKRDVDASVDLNAEFLVNLGHEFRTSLNDILGGLSLLTESQLETHQQELLNLAQKAGERQLDLVNNIVDFSRINNRKLVLDHSVFNLRSQLEQWIEGLAVDAHQQSVEIDYDIHQAVPLRAHGDANRIGQVFKNLLSNAIQFSEQGRIDVDIDFRRDTDRGGHLDIVIVDRLATHALVTVDDTDDPDQLMPIASTGPQPQTIKDVTTRTTGLWFAICKGLSECMGGTVDIDSTAGQETHYRFYLPLRAAGQQPANINSHPKLIGKRVLLVSSGIELSEPHLKEMQRWGLEISHCASFDQAKRLIASYHKRDEGFNLVVINLHLNTDEAIEFSQSLLNASSPAPAQLYLLSHAHLNLPPLQQLITDHEAISYQFRPVIRQSLHDCISHAILGKPLVDEKSEVQGHVNAHDFKVLLVDDHRVNQMVAEGMLKKLGYRVQLASNGCEALKAFKEGGADLILMDCQMPEMDGFEATRRIRVMEEESHGDNHIPIVAMTAHTNDGDQSLCFACGMDDYLAKPVRFDVLETRLLRWLGAAVAVSPENKDQREASSS